MSEPLKLTTAPSAQTVKSPSTVLLGPSTVGCAAGTAVGVVSVCATLRGIPANASPNAVVNKRARISFFTDNLLKNQ